MSPQYLTVSEVSEYLKLPEETVYKYARSGRIPASKVGRYWRFERTRVDDWVGEHSNQAQRAPRVLVVDDDPAIRNLLNRWLTEEGCQVSVLAGGVEALQFVEDQDCDLVFLDLMMPSPNGVETLSRIKTLRPDLEVVIVTAYFDSRLMDDALEMGPLTILKKPIDRDALIGLVLGASVRK
jgi:excisionase family DNA binding protein